MAGQRCSTFIRMRSDRSRRACRDSRSLAGYAIMCGWTRAERGCRGCFGPTEDVIDQGAKLVSSIAALIDSDDPDEIQRIVDQIDDPSGYFYRFSLPKSLAFRKIEDAKEVDG